MGSHEEYEQACERIRKTNTQLLTDFEECLKASGLAKKTIKNHESNIDFYINEFLLYYEATEAKDGIDSVDQFLGDWFIRKAMWSNVSSVKSYGTSLKKFYTFMNERNLVSNESLSELKQLIKEEMPEWLSSMEDYGDY